MSKRKPLPPRVRKPLPKHASPRHPEVRGYYQREFEAIVENDRQQKQSNWNTADALCLAWLLLIALIMGYSVFAWAVIW